MTHTAIQVHQVSRPEGRAGKEHFTFVETRLPAVTEGTAVVENRFLSVDPYMRQLMDATDGWDLHAPLEGRTIGRVIESQAPGLSAGDLVFHRKGWASHALINEAEARVLPAVEGVATSNFLSILGGTGLTAYAGLTQVARLVPGDSIFVSSAAGGVGTAVGQFARAMGAERVIGSAGTDAKVAHLTGRLGFDAAFNYRDGDVTQLLSQVAPAGIDVYFENVGGDHLEAAIHALRDRGRIVVCGMVSQYDGVRRQVAPRNLIDVCEKALRMEGLRVRDFTGLREEFETWAIPLVRSGTFVADETIVDGFDNIVDAFLAMLDGGNLGKMIVRV